MPKCPYCPSTEFDIGKITVGKNGSAEVIYCVQCKAIISFLDKSLIKPKDENNLGSVIVNSRGL